MVRVISTCLDSLVLKAEFPPIHVVEVNRAVKLLFSVNSPDFSKR